MMYKIVTWISIFCICLLKTYADMVYSGCDTNNVSVIDTKSNTVIATITTTEATSALALTPNQKFLYIASNSDSVYVVDTSNNMVIATLDGFTQASSMIANDKFAYVGDIGTQTLSVIDVASNTVVASFPGAAGYSKMGMTPDSRLVFSSTANLNQVVVIDTQTNIIIATIDVRTSDKTNSFTNYDRAYLLGLNGDVTIVDTTTKSVIATVIVSEPGWAAPIPDGSLYVVGLFGNTVTVIDHTNTVAAAFSAVDFDGGFVIARPDGKFVYAAGNPDISVIDTSTQMIVSTIDTNFSLVNWLACSPDSRFVYASLAYNNAVAVIDTQTNAIIATIPVQNSPSQLVYVSDDFRSSVSSSSGSFDPSGRQIKQRFFTQTDLVNVISWTPPANFTPIVYNLYRDPSQTILAGSVPATQLKFEDHNRVKKKIYTYYLIAVDVDGNTLNMGAIQVLPIN